MTCALAEGPPRQTVRAAAADPIETKGDAPGKAALERPSHAEECRTMMQAAGTLWPRGGGPVCVHLGCGWVGDAMHAGAVAPPRAHAHPSNPSKPLDVSVLPPSAYAVPSWHQAIRYSTSHQPSMPMRVFPGTR
jgi:hypothetical protein